MIGHKVLADQVSRAYGFKVEISGMASMDSNEGGWRSVSGGGLRIHEDNGSATFGQDQYKSTTRGMCEWEPITLVGAVTKDRKDCITWFKDMVQTGDEAACYKDLSITLVGPDGQDLYTINYLECFLMSYTLGELNSTGDGEPLYETIEVCVGHSDNLLS